AAEHKAMAEAYKKSVPGPTKGTGENPWAKKMEAHCRAIEKDAEKLATDAEKATEFPCVRKSCNVSRSHSSPPRAPPRGAFARGLIIPARAVESASLTLDRNAKR
ncbi:MAG: hypothetical protein JWM53_702, partial [bacterium]|nr:hypothetical protein [bacterium]